jgi:phosphatidylglycerophosphatase C
MRERTAGGAAFFDFDGTLVRGDSLLPFLSQVVGYRRARLSLVQAIRTGFLLGRRTGGDIRTAIKEVLLALTLKGVPLTEAQAAAERLADWPRWNVRIRDELNRHRDAGRRIVVATGALAVYMPVLLRGLPVDHLLATELEVEDGVLTGRMAGGNCVRASKAERVARYLAEHGPFGETWGYGNRPSDLAMLDLLHNRTIV